MTTVFALALLLAQQPPAPPPPRPTFEELLKKMAPAAAEPCFAEGDRSNFSELEWHLFDAADGAVEEGLNGTAAGSPKARASERLLGLERLSAEVNKGWPDANRFHFEVSEMAPLVLVKMTFRGRATFSAFGVSERDYENKPSKLWHSVGWDEHRSETVSFQESIGLYPLHRSPDGRARFLVSYVDAGCAGSYKVEYFAYEWDPRGSGDLERIIEVAGAEGLSDESFGELRTEGPILTLPYCWFSAIDWWDNPTMCAVDSYDLSGDEVRFVSRVVNHPDWLPIVRAIQYAQAHDYPAVRAYCGSPEVARRLVSIVPTFVRGEVEPNVKKTGPATETVEFGGFRFEVEKRGGRWLVEAMAHTSWWREGRRPPATHVERARHLAQRGVATDRRTAERSNWPASAEVLSRSKAYAR